jgi:hypothetical protein
MTALRQRRSFERATIFVGRLGQKGGDGTYAECWVVRLNERHVEVQSDPDYARGLVERLICDELQRIVPAYKRIRAGVPPRECFRGQDSHSKWMNWKAERGLPPYDKKQRTAND